jgi:hydrogenase/urease accessory protein HupE
MFIFRSFLLLYLFYLPLFAHQTGLSYVIIKEIQANDIKILYKKPLSDTRGEDITIRYPKICSEPKLISHTIENGFILRAYKIDCKQEGLLHKRVWVDGLLSKDRGVLISYERGAFKVSALLRAPSPFIHISKESSGFELFKEYIVLGVEHIWSGYDHLMFVLCLILLSPSLKKLLWSITGFTFAHSITLAFGILGIITVGVPYIEAMIAMSILFLARELLMEKETFTKQHLGVVAFIFGLLHGFGFSSVLRSIGLPQDEIPLSLLAFNLGIEIGQLLFIVSVSVVLYLLKRYVQVNELKIRRVLAYIVGGVTSFWFIERVMAF